MMRRRLGPGGRGGGAYGHQRQRQRDTNNKIIVRSVSAICFLLLWVGYAYMFRQSPGAGESRSPRSVRSNLKKSNAVKWPTAISVSLPKCGTTSLYQMLSECSDYRVSHYCCGSNDEGRHEYPCAGELRNDGQTVQSSVCSELLTQQIEQSSSVLGFPSASQFDIFTQLDGELESRPKGYFLPQSTHLQELYDLNPTAIWILTQRDAHAWAKSVQGWLDLANRLETEFGQAFEYTDTADFLLQFYHQHTKHIQNFVKEHPSIKLVTIDIASPDAGKSLAEVIPGVKNDRGCWKQRNAGPFFRIGSNG